MRYLGLCDRCGLYANAMCSTHKVPHTTIKLQAELAVPLSLADILYSNILSVMFLASVKITLMAISLSPNWYLGMDIISGIIYNLCNYIYIIMVNRWRGSNSVWFCLSGYSIRLTIAGQQNITIVLDGYLMNL